MLVSTARWQCLQDSVATVRVPGKTGRTQSDRVVVLVLVPQGAKPEAQSGVSWLIWEGIPRSRNEG